MKTSLSCLCLFTSILFSCNNNSIDDYTSPDSLAQVPVTTKNDTLISKKTDSGFTPLLNPADQVISVSPNNTAPVTTTMPTKTTQPATTKQGLNPEHGQPGHRCDIAVGAPLNTPVTQLKPTTTTTTTTKPQTITTTPIATPVTKTTQKTAPGMNPPHGEPGHRCDISVGAPLNSAPNKTTDKPAIIATDAGVSAADSTKK